MSSAQAHNSRRARLTLLHLARTDIRAPAGAALDGLEDMALHSTKVDAAVVVEVDHASLGVGSEPSRLARHVKEAALGSGGGVGDERHSQSSESEEAGHLGNRRAVKERLKRA